MDAFIWRLVYRRMATLHELETTWSIEDAQHAHAYLDAIEEAEAKAAQARGG